MHDAKTVHVNQSFEESAHNLFGLFLIDASVFVDALEEISSSEKLSDHENGGLGFHNTHYFDYIFVIHDL